MHSHHSWGWVSFWTGTEDPHPTRGEHPGSLSQDPGGTCVPLLAAGGLWPLRVFQNLSVSPLGGWGFGWRRCGPDPAWQDPGMGAGGPGEEAREALLELDWEGSSCPVSGQILAGLVRLYPKPSSLAVLMRCLSLWGQAGVPFSPVSLWTSSWLSHPWLVPPHRRWALGLRARDAGDSSLAPVQCGALERLVPLLPQGAGCHWDLVPATAVASQGGVGGGPPRDLCFQGAPPSPVLPGLFLVFN